MPIEVRDTDGGLGNLFIYSGIIEEKEIIDVVARHHSQDNDILKQYKYSLSDLTAVEKIELSTKTVEYIAKFTKKTASINPDVIISIVADNDLTFGLSRMLGLLRSDTNWDEMVFRNRVDAENWTKEMVKTKFGIENITFQ